MDELLKELRAELELTDANNKVASLQLAYDADADGDTKIEFYNRAHATINEKIAAWEDGDYDNGLEPISEGTKVLMAASIGEEAYELTLRKQAVAQINDELDELEDDVEDIMKEAGIDLREVLASEDEELINDCADIAAAIISSEE